MKRMIIALSAIACLMIAGCQFETKSENNSDNDKETISETEIDNRKLTIVGNNPSYEDIDKFEPLAQFFEDIIKDGNSDKITLYTSAGRDMKGEMMWDDSQVWILRIETENGIHDLYNERISGYAYMNVSDYYNGGESEKVISLYIFANTFNEIREYRFDGENFVEEIVYSTDSTAKEGIGTLYSSVPKYE